MDLERIESLLKMLAEHDVSEFSYRDGDMNLKLRLGPPPAVAMPVAMGHAPAPVAAAAAPAAAAGHAAPAAAAASDEGLHIVESPMVGTMYRSPSPGAPHFVEVGQTVQKGKTLCIVEAMKLMNEIEADVTGVVVEILVDNGKAVQFGQPLMKIRPS
ncbi:MAG: acetyl-CoA carboxylase biotin carboxyl carrier protein [Alphaproteobacteria bacterium]|nr:acetyl-CoA carboxylase biotin carboxyl carrier protein [Alphaproteobacteria bacterium]MCB9697882.1 acetyl-CoA carboxylase biotin carboxyl carrier protein [Alphaproteobacteria bacterium]